MPGKLLLPLALSLGLAGCFVEPESPFASVTFALELGEGSGVGSPVVPGAAVDLTERPCYVAVRISAPDLAVPASAAWACAPGSSPGARVDMELSVPAGAAREIEVVAFVAAGSELVTFVSYQQNDLDSGPVTLDVVCDEVPTGTLEATVSGAPSPIVRVVLTDLLTGARLLTLVPAWEEGAAHFNASGLPRGRFFGLEMELESGEVLEAPDCPVYVIGGSVRKIEVDAAAGGC